MTKTDDLTGKDFTYWHVLKKASESGAAKWLCRCKCGTERVVLARSLKSGASKSCGCLRDEAVKKLSEYRTNIAHTSIDIIRSKRLSKNNTTGVTGVYSYHGKYRASITFQKKVYYLGTYSRIETATQVRKQAEKVLHDDFVKFYDKWKEKAENDPIWAAENPISISVDQNDNDSFIVYISPHIE